MRWLSLIAAVLLLAPPARAQTNADVTLWQGKRALEDIAQLLSFGPRAPDTEGHQKTIDYIEAEMKKLGVGATAQSWHSTVAGQSHDLTNVIARFAPDNPRRIILGTHYDSIIRAYAEDSQG